jgi:predicted  nucleic acid-binding Zn-ribbon protein
MRKSEKEIGKLSEEIRNLYNQMGLMRQEFQGSMSYLSQQFQIEKLQKENEELKEKLKK